MEPSMMCHFPKNPPVGGMPIIDIDKARTVIVIKRSLSPGFAGIPNPLFAADNTLMLFGDGKKAVLEIVSALKLTSFERLNPRYPTNRCGRSRNCLL